MQGGFERSVAPVLSLSLLALPNEAETAGPTTVYEKSVARAMMSVFTGWPLQ